MPDVTKPTTSEGLLRWQPRMSRALAVLVGSLMVFTVLVMAYYGMWVDWKIEQQSAHMQAERTARTGAELQNSLLQSTKVLLDTMATTPVVRWGASTQLRELFKAILPKHDQRYVWWMILNADSTTLVRVGQGVIGLMDDSWLNFTQVTVEARVTRRFSVGDYVLAGNQLLLPMAAPVLDDSGRIVRFLLVAWDVSVGSEHLKPLLDKGDHLFFISPTEEILFKYPADLPLTGNMLPEAMQHNVAQGQMSVRNFEISDTPLGPRVISMVPMFDDHGRLLAYAVGSVAKPTFSRFVMQRYAEQLISFSVLLVSALLLTWLFCRRFITAGLEHLTLVARRTSLGDLSVRNNLGPGCVEVQTVAQAYDRMLDTLASHTRELSDREQRLTLALDAAQQGVWTWRPDIPCLECDSRLARLLGLNGSVCLTPEELYERIHPTDREQLLHGDGLFRAEKNSEFRREFRALSASDVWTWLLFIGRVNPENGNFFGIAMDVTRRKEADDIIRADAERYKLLSNTDSLTGLWNRRYFTQVVTAEIRRARRYRRSFTLALCDLDFFKRVNDTYGHDAGDAVLIHFARLLQENLRESDVVARVGGEEFAFFLPETDLERSAVVFEKIRRITEETPVFYGDKIIHFTVSCGIVPHNLTSVPDATYNQLFTHADSALYKAKNTGRNKVQVAR